MRKQFVVMGLFVLNVFGCMAGEVEEDGVAEAEQQVAVGTCSVACPFGNPVTIDNCTGGICTANEIEHWVSCTGRGPGHFDVTLYCPEPLEEPASEETSTLP